MANQNNIEWAMQAEPEEEELHQQNHVPPPCGETSRTLDDFINSINFETMGQFLKSIEEIDQPQPPSNFSTTTPASVAGAQPTVFFQPESENVRQPPPMILQKEEKTLISSMPFTICQKTVNQVWNEIFTGNQQQNHQEYIQPPQSQETNEWMSLMEYLSEAGVSVPRELSHPPPPSTPPQIFAPLCSIPSINSIEIEELDLAISNPGIYLDNTISEYDGGSYTYTNTNQQQLDINVPMEATLVVVDGDNQDEEMDIGGGRRRRRKRGINGALMDVVSDKMKRRMIKNRETAARSRARKQAHNAELEEMIDELKIENYILKQDLAEMKKKVQRAQVRDKRSSGKVRKLLRSSSC